MKKMNRILSLLLAILLAVGMAPMAVNAEYDKARLTEEMVTWEKLHFYYDGNGHCPEVTVSGIDDVILTQNVDYTLECGYYVDDGTTSEFVPFEEFPVEVGVYICRIQPGEDYYTEPEIATEFEIEVCPWGTPVNYGGITNYVDAGGTTSAEITKQNMDANGLLWLKEKSGDTSAWYGIDNSDGVFEPGSRFWVKWLNNEEDMQAFKTYYDQLDDEVKNKIKDDLLWIFTIGVTDPDGNEYTDLSQPVNCYVELGDDWDSGDVEAVYISDKTDEAVSTKPAPEISMLIDNSAATLTRLNLKHFSPYAVYEKKNNTQTQTGESVWWSYDDTTDTLTISDSPAQGRQEFTVEAQKCADAYTMPWNIPGKWYSNMKAVIIDGSPRPAYVNSWFCNASNLTEIRNLRQLDTSCVTSMKSMFNSCTNLTQIDLSGFQTANVKSFNAMFACSSSLRELNLSSFDTSAATDFSAMFNDCSSLTELDLSGLSVQNNFNCTSMFSDCESLKTLKLFSLASGCQLTGEYVFSNCAALETIYAPCTSDWSNALLLLRRPFVECGKLTGGKGSAYNVFGNGVKYLRFDGGENAPGYLTELHPQDAVQTRHENETAPGCETAGSCDEVICCTACNQEVSRNQITIPATGHTPGTSVKENIVESTCETAGRYEEVVSCTVCGDEMSRKTVIVPATDHEDADNDGKCDHCGKQMQGGDHCKWCGKVHGKQTFRGVVTSWFHTLVYYAKTYVVPVLGILWYSFLSMLLP